jgi:hypothetical protein
MKEYRLQKAFSHRVHYGTALMLGIDFEKPPDYVQYISLRKQLPRRGLKAHFDTGDDAVILVSTGFMGFVGFVISLTLATSLISRINTIMSGKAPISNIEGSMYDKIPSFLHLPLFLIAMFLFFSGGLLLCFLFFKVLRGDFLNPHIVTKTEEYFAEIIRETAGITNRPIEYYVEASVQAEKGLHQRLINRFQGNKDGRVLAYRLRTIDPNWEMDQYFDPFIQVPGVLALTGVFVSLGWGFLSLYIFVKDLITGDWQTTYEGNSGLLNFIVGYTIFLLIFFGIGIYLGKIHLLEASHNLWNYQSERRKMIQAQKKYMAILDAKETSSPDDISLKLDLLNARWTLERLENSPRLPLSTFQRFWYILAVFFTVVGFFLNFI